MVNLPNPRVINIPENVTHVLFKFLKDDINWEEEREYFEDNDTALKAVANLYAEIDRFERFELLNIKTKQLYIFEKN